MRSSTLTIPLLTHSNIVVILRNETNSHFLQNFIATQFHGPGTPISFLRTDKNGRRSTRGRLQTFAYHFLWKFIGKGHRRAAVRAVFTGERTCPEQCLATVLIPLQFHLQVGPIDRISLPKDKDGTQKSFGFVEYRHQKSVPYALSVFAGTKLFNRELRLNPRDGNTGNNKPQMALEPQPMMTHSAPTHQFQMHNPSMSALRYGVPANAGLAGAFSDMLPRMPNLPQMNDNGMIDMETLLGLSAQLLHSGMVGNDPNDTHSHQTKMMHRHEHRSHHQNSNYGRRNDRDYDRDYDRRGGNDRRDRDRRNRSRERGDNNSNKRRHDRR